MSVSHVSAQKNPPSSLRRTGDFTFTYSNHFCFIPNQISKSSTSPFNNVLSYFSKITLWILSLVSELMG